MDKIFFTTLIFSLISIKGLTKDNMCLTEENKTELYDTLNQISKTEFVNCDLNVSLTDQNPSFFGFVSFYNKSRGQAGIHEFPLSLDSHRDQCIYDNRSNKTKFEFKLWLIDDLNKRYFIHQRFIVVYETSKKITIDRVEFSSRDTMSPLRATPYNKVLEGNRSHWSTCYVTYE